MKLATVIRKDEENDIPKSSSLNKKTQIFLDRFQIIFLNI